LIEDNGNEVTAFITLFAYKSFLLKVEKKGKERRHTWGEYVGETLGENVGRLI
jgi:hypothetical protein